MGGFQDSSFAFQFAGYFFLIIQPLPLKVSDAEGSWECEDFFFLFFAYYFAFIISIETEASLLALAKSIYYFV